ncbi:MAG: TPM domain-containing protein [Clostridia bacterium]|nr:TPM domain-containing protein [Clostridia bacterium]
MKKVLLVILTIFIFTLFTPAAFAQGEFVVDDADLLTEEMEATLLSEISSIQENYNIDVVIHTTMSIGDEDIHSYSENFYLSNGYAEDGLVFVINLNNNEVGNRDFYTYYQGTVYDTFGDEAYNSDYGVVNEVVLPYLAEENYYEAFHTYLKVTFDFVSGNYYNFNSDSYPNYEDQYQSGEYWEDDYYTDGAIVTYPSNSMSPVIKELIVIVVAGIVAFVIMSIMKSKMNTAVVKNEASDYVKAGSMNITRQLDIFTHRHITKTAKPKNNSSSGGGRSGGSIGGGGGRSGGGGGKF